MAVVRHRRNAEPDTATSGASGTACSSRAPAKYKVDVGPGTLVTYRFIWLVAARLALRLPSQARKRRECAQLPDPGGACLWRWLA